MEAAVEGNILAHPNGVFERIEFALLRTDVMHFGTHFGSECLTQTCLADAWRSNKKPRGRIRILCKFGENFTLFFEARERCDCSWAIFFCQRLRKRESGSVHSAPPWI